MTSPKNPTSFNSGGVKEILARKLLAIAKKLPNDKKKQMVDDFKAKHKDRPDIDGLVHQFCESIDYKENEKSKKK